MPTAKLGTRRGFLFYVLTLSVPNLQNITARFSRRQTLFETNQNFDF
jgi:hypothetical protein